ncbi:mitochondrial large ribosomal subunit [Calycina marina]|uniref:Mitochondrial large ribosomal subunit n=1 Tax=Calycina marina TaxID=1763456 RepID=A0A9P7ZA35_9HELO|nr:mitochondrial large ribosomal subunit [Calycina marina]
MSLRLPARRVINCQTKSIPASKTLNHTPVTYQQRSAKSTGAYGWMSDKFKNPFNKDVTPKPISPLTEEYLKKKPEKPATLIQGDLAPSSIFEDESIAGPKPKTSNQKIKARNPLTMAAIVDPRPENRKIWERKMVIRQIRKRGRLTKTQLLKRQEREYMLKSHDFKTSVKKMVPLAKQITGKTIDEAIIQMRFSKKKVAKDVREHLEHIKNEAIVRRGMGLKSNDTAHFTPVEIVKKDGKRKTVKSPTTMYIEQAWCGKGLFDTTPDFRARGQMHIMKNRTTSISIVLKEEKTRIRLHEERIAKENRKKIWVQLPNRPITAQRQYYSW